MWLDSSVIISLHIHMFFDFGSSSISVIDYMCRFFLGKKGLASMPHHLVIGWDGDTNNQALTLLYLLSV